jgi:uncharacterized caspase-like protein
MVRCLILFASLFVAGIASAAAPVVAERWAVLIGVDDYAYAQKLKYCGADQRALRDQLVASGFPKDHVFLLHDKDEDLRLRPSKGNIERHLELVLNLADAKDLVVIGFSGHGVHLGGKSYLCPGDGTLDDPKSLVGVDDVYERLMACAAGFKLVVVDACRNDPRPGGTRAMTATDGTRAMARTLQELKLPEGVVLLNSCAPGEVSWEDEGFGHGVFMHYLLDGLRGAAHVGGDGHVSLTELQAYAGTRTKTYVANRHRVAQRPFFKGDLTTEALEYALLPVPAKPAATANVEPLAPPVDRMKQGALGVTLDSKFTTEKARELGLTSRVGAHVLRVTPRSPAERAQIQPGDVIYRFNGVDIRDDEHLVYEISRTKEGEGIPVLVLRNRQWKELTTAVTTVGEFIKSLEK